ncbi:MAG: hypothetical protein IJU04_02865 [Ruminococcus sp.]|nr:hypothetical protein [Ruminococcus sp.]
MLRFHFGKININVSFTFFAVLALIVLLQNAVLYSIIIALSCCLLHELGHLIAMAVVSQTPNDITLYGGGIKISSITTSQISYNSELLILFAGSAVNILIYIILIMINNELSSFATANLFFGIFNLMPLKYFDGGRILGIVLKSTKLICIIRIVFVILFAILIFFMLTVKVYNISFLLTFLYILISEFII